MILGRLILKCMPFSTYHRLRSLYRGMVKSLYRPLSEADFIDILVNRLKIREGDVVFIHSSIDKLNISFSPFRLLAILLDMVGKDGTLLFPAWHFNQRAEDYLKSGKVFDVRRSPSALGLLSELARRHPEARRSLHPTTSVVAIGKHAETLLKEHGTSIYPCDETSPFYKIMELGGKIIGLGVTTEFLSFVHCPEDVLKDKFPVRTRTSEIFTAKVKDYAGNILETETLAADKGIGKRDIPGFIRHHIPGSSATEFSVRHNSFFLVDSGPFYKNLVAAAKKGLTIYLSQT